jgi:hypothetical protein
LKDFSNVVGVYPEKFMMRNALSQFKALTIIIMPIHDKTLSTAIALSCAGLQTLGALL